MVLSVDQWVSLSEQKRVSLSERCRFGQCPFQFKLTTHNMKLLLKPLSGY